MILLLTLIGRFADNTASLMTPQTSLSDVLVSRPRRACYIRKSPSTITLRNKNTTKGHNPHDPNVSSDLMMPGGHVRET